MKSPPCWQHVGDYLPEVEEAQFCRVRTANFEEYGYCSRRVYHPPCWQHENIGWLTEPLVDVTTLQSPGASGGCGATFGKYRNGGTTWHKGWDIHAEVGTPVYAVANGSVKPYGYEHDDLGYFVDVEPADGDTVFRYSHLKNDSWGVVSWGEQVAAGETVDEVGVTGNSSTDRPHLHLIAFENGEKVDPGPYVPVPGSVIDDAGNIEAFDPNECASE